MTSMRSTQSKAGAIGIRSALFGSLLFGIVEAIPVEINETDTVIEILGSKLAGIVLIFGISSVLSILPGYLGGKILERQNQKSNWNRLSLMILGATLGIIAVAIISLPVLFVVLAAHNYWSIENNPAFTIYVKRLIEIVVIAGLMGTWASSQIAKS